MNAHFKCAPVLLINFNRSDFSARQIDILREIKPAQVFYAVDGARELKEGEREKVEAVKDLVDRIDWPCEVKTLFQSNNLGCKLAPSSAISWFFGYVDAGIILEDDCHVGIEFFRFASELLERYNGDQRVGAISAMNLYDMQSDKSVSYHFNTHINIWGWATWKRVWQNYTVDISKYKDSRYDIVKRGLFTKRAQFAALKAFDAVENGLQTWDYQLGFLFMSLGLLVAVPKVKLVGNVGFTDNRGTNIAGYNFDAYYMLKRGTMQFPLKHPLDVCPDVSKIKMEELREYALLPRVLTRIGCLFPAIEFLLDRIGHFIECRIPWLFRL